MLALELRLSCTNPSIWKLNTLRFRQNALHFTDNIFTLLFLYENFSILIQIKKILSCRFCPKCSHWYPVAPAKARCVVGVFYEFSFGSDNDNNSAPSHYLNQCWVIANWTLRNKIQRNFNQNTKQFIHGNASENIVCKIATILSGGDELVKEFCQMSFGQWPCSFCESCAASGWYFTPTSFYIYDYGKKTVI